MRRAAMSIALGFLTFASPAFAVTCLEGTPPDPTFKNGLRPGIMHMRQFPVHELTYVRQDASLPNGLGTVVLSGHKDNLDEVENYYLSYFRKKGWQLAEKQPNLGFDLEKGEESLTIRERTDECRGFTLTFTFVRYAN
jgi:hypothetical protein